MKKVFMRKTAALLATVMLVSMLVPMVAFANFVGVTKDSAQVVTGQVYVDSDVYSALNGDDVVINVYRAGQEAAGPITTVYTTYVSEGGSITDSYYYSFELDLNSLGFTSNESLVLNYWNPVTSTYVYLDGTVDYTYSSGNIGGGGFFFAPSNGGSEISVGSDGKVDATALANALKAYGDVTLKLSGDFVLLPAIALTEGKSITIVKADGTSYKLPLSVFDLDGLTESVGVELKDLFIRVGIKALAGDAAKAVTDAIAAIGGKSLSAAVEFTMTAEGNGKTVEVKNFGKTYVSRTIPLTEESTTAVGVLFNPASGKFSFVPTNLKTENGKTTATLKRNGNSIYTVIEVSKSFADLEGHWAQAEVEALASKLVVEGTSATTFEPRRNITRAEFAAMIVRSLGLEAAGTSNFSDVSSNKWYAGAVAAAAEAGIVKGYGNGTFKPEANITRKELAAMVVRAMEFAGTETALTDAEANAALASFTDAGNLGWAKAEVASAVDAGIVNGQSATRVAGEASANRAEAAAMVLRFLTKVEFID
ncbi:S-layer homology domain-containing protein [Paenibacillus tarimensis]